MLHFLFTQMNLKEPKSNKKCSILYSKNHKFKKTCSDLNNLNFSNSFLLDKFNTFCNLFDTKYLTVHSKNNLLNSVTWKIPLDILNKSYLNYFNNFDYIKIDNINNQLIIGKFIKINPSILKIVKNISSSIHVSSKSFHNLGQNIYLIKVSTDNITKAALTLYYIQNLDSNSNNIDLSIDNIQISYKKLIKDFLENKSTINIEWFNPEEFQENTNKNIITLNINNLSDLHTDEINTGSKTSEKLVLSLDTDNTTNNTTENSDIETIDNDNLNNYLDKILESLSSNNSVIIESEIDIIESPQKKQVEDNLENQIYEEEEAIEENQVIEEKEVDEIVEENQVIEEKEVDEIVEENQVIEEVEENQVIEEKEVDEIVEENQVIEEKDVYEEVEMNQDIEEKEVNEIVEENEETVDEVIEKVDEKLDEDKLKEIVSKNCLYLKNNCDFEINKIINNLIKDIENSDYDDLILLMELTHDMINSLNLDYNDLQDDDFESISEETDLESIFEENQENLDLLNRLFNK